MICVIIPDMDRKEPLATNALPDLNWKKRADAESEETKKYVQRPTQRQFLVLVVDDSVDNLVVVSLDLQGEGYRVVTASNGEEAVNVAALTKPDLILMDISMPRLDGLGATRRIHENSDLKDVPVIAITAHSSEGFRRAAYDVGIEGYLVKPIDSQRMHELVRRLLGAKESGGTTGLV